MNNPANYTLQRAFDAMCEDAPGADPVLQAQFRVALKHFHAMLDELKLTDQQLYRIATWMGKVAQQDELVMLCDMMGLTMRALDLARTDDHATPQNVTGPFPKDEIAEGSNPCHIATEDEPGQRLEVRGRVLDAATGQPVPGAMMIVWQPNQFGRYENEDDSQSEDNLRGKLRCEADGSFQVFTIRPGGYIIGREDTEVGVLMKRLGRNRQRAPHIHYRVMQPGYRTLTSQLYFAGDPANPVDCIFSTIDDHIVDALPHPERDGYQLVNLDIVLQPETAQ
ncbi:protocatechuate 3,4-dioxygenase [Cupriavidus sp. SK-4]|uniref:dioxygenase family protein n=1 Tax=Cupriavidus sp. SK-4 TaxID=574750 RepID=UPI00045260D0|nr:protocatechuate 3,4-dioxygenase [Cupriavidus sp. SK-4]EYS86165.1 protocatechuate 3,4-dioxygenase [Cupriavidus sp. SK-4]